MKTAQCVLVLFYATMGLGFPIKIIFTDGTPTILAGNRAMAGSQRNIATEKLVTQGSPSSWKYVDGLQEAPTVSIGDGRESASSTPIASPVSSPGTHDTFLGKLISNDDHGKDTPARSPSRTHTDSTRWTIPYLRAADFLDILDKHGPECVALCLFVLVPIAYFVLELLELAIKSRTREQFPRRGRDRVRLIGPERQLRAWRNRERETMVECEKQWWQASRARY